MKRLTKQQLKERDAIANLIKVHGGKLEDAINDFNAKIADLFAGIVSPALVAYNEAVSDAECWRDEIVSTMQEYQDERSEKWHDTDAGQSYHDWQSEFEDSLQIEMIEISEPEEVEMPEFNLAEYIWSLPEEL